MYYLEEARSAGILDTPIRGSLSQRLLNTVFHFNLQSDVNVICTREIGTEGPNIKYLLNILAGEIGYGDELT